MKLHLSKQPSAIVVIPLFVIGIMLSCNVFADKPPGNTYATEEDLDTEIAARIAADTAEVAARQAADATLQSNVDAEVAAREAADDDLQSQIDNAGLPDLPTATSGAFWLRYCADTDSLEWVTGTTYKIGDTGPAGGIVFYVSVSDCDVHGLEAAPEDQGTAPWGCVETKISGADGNAVGTGAQNTVDILAGCSETGIAAELADDYELNGYIDWFLPSLGELDELYLNKGVVGGFNNDNYWSSSEDRTCCAWMQDFDDGFMDAYLKDYTRRVRAVRAF